MIEDRWDRLRELIIDLARDPITDIPDVSLAAEEEALEILTQIHQEYESLKERERQFQSFVDRQ